jgi:hypothetical protein
MATSNPQQRPTQAATSTGPDPDHFDSLLTLEDDFYTQGYEQGHADGLVAGRSEGRQLGLERGFQKFVESGRLQGRAIVWANRLRLGMGSNKPAAAAAVNTAKSDSEGGGGRSSDCGSGSDGVGKRGLPPLPYNARLEKHVAALYALAETESLSTENTDEAVNDFDDRLRRALGRAKIIERMLGEWQRGEGDANGNGDGPHAADHDPDPGAQLKAGVAGV